MNVNDFKELYNNLDIDYSRVQLYYKNCTELKDWYYNQLVKIYEESEDLKVNETIEECHGEHKFYNYTEESIEKIDLFENKLKRILNDKFTNIYNSSNLIN